MSDTSLPVGWQWRSIRELGKTTGGGTPSKAERRYWNGTVPWVSPKDMKTRYIYDTEDHITELGVENSSAKLIPPNSILIVFRSGILVHSLPVAIAQKELAVNQDIKVILPNQQYIPEFIAYALDVQSQRILQTCVKKGATVHSIDGEKFWKERIPVPFPDELERSLDTQHRVVARIKALLAEVQDMRSLQTEIESQTRRFAETTLIAIFQELETTYETKSLGDRNLCDIIPGQHIMATDYNDLPIGTAYITGPADFGEKYPNISKWTSDPKALCYPGDVLLTVKGSGVGKSNCAPREFECAIGRQVMAIRPNPDQLQSDYLYYAIQSKFREFQQLRQGAAIPGIRKEHVQAFKLPIPSIAIQKMVVARLEAINAQVGEMREINGIDSELIDSLQLSILTQAFRGEL